LDRSGVSRRPHTPVRTGRSPRKCPESLVGRQGEQAQLSSKPWTLGLKEGSAGPKPLVLPGLRQSGVERSPAMGGDRPLWRPQLARGVRIWEGAAHPRGAGRGPPPPSHGSSGQTARPTQRMAENSTFNNVPGQGADRGRASSRWPPLPLPARCLNTDQLRTLNPAACEPPHHVPSRGPAAKRRPSPRHRRPVVPTTAALLTGPLARSCAEMTFLTATGGRRGRCGDPCIFTMLRKPLSATRQGSKPYCSKTSRIS
jgi:hypothetical protein